MLPDAALEDLPKVAAKVRQATAKYNDANAILPISYAVGYVLSTELEQPLMKDLLAEADKRMYINKQATKKLTATVEEECSQHLHQMMDALEHGYSACYYCDYQNDTYRTMKSAGHLALPEEGHYSDFLAAFMRRNEDITAEYKELLLEKLGFDYINQHLSSENNYYDIEFRDADNNYWLAHARGLSQLRNTALTASIS